MIIVGLGASVLAGALTQRITGVGFALVAAPFFVITLGPLQGVALANLLGVATATSVYVFAIREVEYRKVLILAAAAIAAAIPGAFLARLLPEDPLSIGAGVLILAALGLSVYARKLRGIHRWPGQVGAGLLSGFMNVIAGVGGPAVTAYAVASRWEHERFAKSVQFYFMIVGAVSFAARGTWPQLAWLDWVIVAACLVAGLVGGHFLSRVIPSRQARVGCMALAVAGALVVIAQAVARMVGWL